MPHAPDSQVGVFLMFGPLWCGVAVVTAALQSRLLYGLRQRIREATQLGQYTLRETRGSGRLRASSARCSSPVDCSTPIPFRFSTTDALPKGRFTTSWSCSKGNSVVESCSKHLLEQSEPPSRRARSPFRTRSKARGTGSYAVSEIREFTMQ